MFLFLFWLVIRPFHILEALVRLQIGKMFLLMAAPVVWFLMNEDNRESWLVEARASFFTNWRPTHVEEARLRGEFYANMVAIAPTPLIYPGLARKWWKEWQWRRP